MLEKCEVDLAGQVGGKPGLEGGGSESFAAAVEVGEGAEGEEEDGEVGEGEEEGEPLHFVFA